MITTTALVAAQTDVLTPVLSAVGSAGFVGLVAWWRFRKIDDATAAKTVSEAAAVVMGEIRANGTQLSKELADERAANRDLRATLNDCDSARRRVETENRRLRAILTAHGLSPEEP